MADYQRKPIVKPKTPPPPPPKPKRTFTETEESLVYNPYNSPITVPKETGEFLVYKSNEIYDLPITVPQGSQPKELLPSAVLSRYSRLQTMRTSPDQKKDDLPTSPPSRIYQNLQAPPLPPRNTVALNTPPERSLSMSPVALNTPRKSLSKSPVAESTPKKGIFRNVYTRARDFFTGKSTTPYASLHQQSSPVTPATTTTPKKQGIFRRIWGSTTPNRRQTTSDTASSPASPNSSYSGYHETSRLDDSNMSYSSNPRLQSPDLSSGVSFSYYPEAPGGRSGTSLMGLRSEDTGSDASSSDMDDDDCYARVQRQGGKLVSIQVNSPANIRVATSDNGEVTACIETASDRKKDE